MGKNRIDSITYAKPIGGGNRVHECFSGFAWSQIANVCRG